MHNGKKIGIALILICVIALIVWVVYEQQKPEEMDKNPTQNIVKNPNDGIGALANQMIGEPNAVEGSLVEKEEEPVAPPSTENSSEVIQESIPDKLEKAKELAAAEWGDMEGFYLYVDERVENEGIYTVEVHDASDTALKCTYLVNVEKGTVEEKAW